MPALAIFPEGTVSNGKVVLAFKKGSFKDLKPIKIVAFKFPYTQFTPFYDYFLSLP